MTTDTRPVPTTYIYEVYIKATPHAIWAGSRPPSGPPASAIKGPVEYDLWPGGKLKANPSASMVAMGMTNAMSDGEVLEADPPHKLVHSYRLLFTERHIAEGFSRATYDIVRTASGFTRLTETHKLEGQPLMAAMVSSTFDERGMGG